MLDLYYLAVAAFDSKTPRSSRTDPRHENEFYRMYAGNPLSRLKKLWPGKSIRAREEPALPTGQTRTALNEPAEGAACGTKATTPTTTEQKTCVTRGQALCAERSSGHDHQQAA